MLILFLFPPRDNVNNVTYLRRLYLLYIAHIYVKYIHQHDMYVFPKRQAEIRDYNRDGERRDVCMGYKVHRYNAISFFYIFESSYFQRGSYFSQDKLLEQRGSSLNVRCLYRLSFIFPGASVALSRPALFSRWSSREKRRG